MRWRSLKPIVFVELPGSIIQRVDQQGSDPCVLRHGMGSADCVLQQGRAKMDSLGALIHGEARQHHDWHRVRHVAPDPAGGKLVGHGAGGHRAVAANTDLRIGRNEGATGATRQLARARRFSQSSNVASPQSKSSTLCSLIIGSGVPSDRLSACPS